MGSSGGGTTRVMQEAPQLIPEGKLGYEKAQEFYQGVLDNPPIYAGPRLAPITTGQEEYMAQSLGYFGGQQPAQALSERETMLTAGGAYLPRSISDIPTLAGLAGDVYNPVTSIGAGGRAQNVAAPRAEYSSEQGPMWAPPTDEEIQRITRSASQPYLRRLEQFTLPEINADFALAGGGVANERELVEKNKALDRTTEIIASDVIAPVMIRMEELEQGIINSERDRMAAIASGDADRITRASQTTASLQAQLDSARDQLEATGAIAAMEAGERRRQLAAQLGTGIYESERERMFRSPEMVSTMMGNEVLREQMLRAEGEYERALAQEAISTEREIFEEPLFRQSQAASALGSMSGVGPGGSLTKAEQQGVDIYGDVMTGVSTAVMVAAIAAKALSAV